jgi:sugar phosphate isomerase/epimerase
MATSPWDESFDALRRRVFDGTMTVASFSVEDRVRESVVFMREVIGRGLAAA